MTNITKEILSKDTDLKTNVFKLFYSNLQSRRKSDVLKWPSLQEDLTLIVDYEQFTTPQYQALEQFFKYMTMYLKTIVSQRH
jgi:hypothetical protein